LCASFPLNTACLLPPQRLKRTRGRFKCVPQSHAVTDALTPNPNHKLLDPNQVSLCISYLSRAHFFNKLLCSTEGKIVPVQSLHNRHHLNALLCIGFCHAYAYEQQA